VTVFDWDALSQTDDAIVARITCSGGTYIRALARDLGRLTHSAAHLAALRRLRAGPFAVDSAATVEQIRDGNFALLPLRAAIPSIPFRQLAPEELRRVVHGNAIPATDVAARVALLDDTGDLVAVAEGGGSELRPKLVLRDV
jgi:tRNA pseudouridine55 synthase